MSKSTITIKEIEKQWPFTFPLDHTKGELTDAVVNANCHIDWLVEKVKELQTQHEVLVKDKKVLKELFEQAEANAKSTQISLDWWIADNMKIIAERKEAAARVKELQEAGIKLNNNLCLSLERAEARVKELESELEECKKEIQFHTLNNNHWAEQNRKLEADLKSAEEGLIRSSNPDNPWMGIHAECKGWMDRARRAEADLAKEKVRVGELEEGIRQIKPYLATETEILNDASLNEGRASGFAVASLKLRKLIEGRE